MKRFDTEVGIVEEGSAFLLGLAPMVGYKPVSELCVGETGIYTKWAQHHQKVTHIAVTRLEDAE